MTRHTSATNNFCDHNLSDAARAPRRRQWRRRSSRSSSIVDCKLVTLLSAVPQQSEELVSKALTQPLTCDAVDLNPPEAVKPSLAMQWSSEASTVDPGELSPVEAVKPSLAVKVSLAVNPGEISASDALFASEEMVSGLVTVLSHWVKEAANQGGACKPGPFHSLCVPAISIGEYLQRIRKYFFCSDECFLIALIYMDRLGKISPSAAVSDHTVHRLLLASVMLAAKFQDDVFYSNRHYAQVGGLKVQELNRLEAGMLRLLGWKMAVSPQEYELYHGLVSEATCHSI